MLRSFAHFTVTTILCISFLVVALLISGCSNETAKTSLNQLDFLKPAHFVFNQMPSNADIIYKQGWQDGCNSGISTFSNEFYKTFYSFQMKEALMRRTNYQRAWETAYHYCRGYVYGIVKEGEMRTQRGHQNPIKLQGLDQWINGWGPQMFENWWVKDDQ